MRKVFLNRLLDILEWAHQQPDAPKFEAGDWPELVQRFADGKTGADRIERLESYARHYHVGPDRICKQCGFDLTDAIHIREGAADSSELDAAYGPPRPPARPPTTEPSGSGSGGGPFGYGRGHGN